MTPIRLSHTWTRRLYVGIFLLSLVYIVVYALRHVNIAVPEAVNIDLIGFVGATLAAIGSLAGFFMAKSTSSFMPAFIVYLVFAITTVYVVQQTGGVASPYLALWTVVALFAALFGAYGWLPVLVLTAVYVAMLYLDSGFTTQNLILVGLSSLAPLIAGMLVWREQAEVADTSEKNVKNLANQLSEVATKSEIVINAIGDGVIALDGKGVIQLINPAAQKILGWGKQDALMLSYGSILKLSDEAGTEITPDADPIQQVLNNNQQARNSKLTAVTNSGRKVNLSIVVSPIGAPGAGAIAVFRDTTNERAEEREQAEFISTASHEMRTPVASIEGYLGLALNPNTAQIDVRARDFIMKAHEAAQHLGRLFQDLLDVSKSEDGRMTNIPRVVDIVQYTDNIAQGLIQKAADKGLQLVFKPTGGEGGAQRKIMPVYFVNQDNDHIREIIDNLIENAIKYTPTGMVTVDVNGTDDKVVVSIQDTGLGIPPEDLPHLFQKFYRVENMDRQSIGGTGLGLYLARRLAEAMQGRLWVESEFTKGSTFFLELPRIDNLEAESLKAQQDAAAAQTAAQAAIQQPVTPAAPVQQPAPTAPIQPVAMPVAAQPAAQPVAPQPVAPQQYQPVPQQVQPQVQPPQPVPQPQQYQPPAPQPAFASASLAASMAQLQPREAPQINTGVRPATTVPRGESLTREQIAERVKQLEALSQAQRGAGQGRQ